ncbi:conserved hypothetical protein [uncultured Desulfobacterium sp.]|uniref:DNA photolyase n=1 Tax=uncultured Desulfobacterium sp. TaxID=201089 RepID=A0A445MTC7_9BACT|nr:conserved hypothetical protein [uncultured Desulfobacterium sp.]
MISEPAIRKIIVEPDALRHDMTHRILQKLPETPVQNSTENADIKMTEQDMGKETLHLLAYKGDFLKQCPGTRNYICCGYQILNLATNCPIECSYCILQSYFNQPDLRLFVNVEEGLVKVLDSIDKNPEKIYRIGTGEFTDSLALDHVSSFSSLLIPEFTKRKNVILEFKTKTTQVNGLIDSQYRDRIVVSWSLNSPFISTHEEHNAASITKRLEAASRCQEEGFILGFHFDPIVCHHNWKDGYAKTVELLDKYIDPKGIIWISLGGFRFMPELKGIIRRRHQKSCVLNGEFIVGLDGKMRYFKPIRLELFSFMQEKLNKWHPDMGIYLCMESDDVWKMSLGWSPKDSEGLSRFLDNRVEMIFG